MTLATSGSAFSDASADTSSTHSQEGVKTGLDCDILTMAHSARAYGKGTARAALDAEDPLQALYKPLGNRDVACFLTVKGR